LLLPPLPHPSPCQCVRVASERKFCFESKAFVGCGHTNHGSLGIVPAVSFALSEGRHSPSVAVARTQSCALHRLIP